MILVLTNSRDGMNTDVVLAEIKNSGTEVIRMDTDRITSGQELLSAGYGSSTRETLTLDTGESTFDLAEVTSVWFRRPYCFDFGIADRVQRDVAEEEVRDILEGVWETLSGRSWVSAPHVIARARLKLKQLAIARRFGLRVAESLVTNDPARAAGFCSSGPTVFKPVAGYHFDYEDRTYSALTTLLTDEHIGNLDLVRRQPVLFQRWIAKAYEIRATYVHDKFYTCRISSPDFAEVVDWREPGAFSELAYEVMELPADLEAKTRSMLDHFGLQYAAVDFAVDADGSHYFLEVNPVGQWLWIEEETGLPISGALARLLIDNTRR